MSFTYKKNRIQLRINVDVNRTKKKFMFSFLEKNLKEKQPQEMEPSKLPKESQSNKIEDFVKITPHDKETSIEVSRVLPEIDEARGTIKKVENDVSEQNEKKTFEEKKGTACVLLERGVVGSESQRKTIKHDGIKGPELKVINPVKFGEVISRNSNAITNISSSVPFFKKLNSAPISKLLKRLSSNFEEQLKRKYSEPSSNLMWLPSTEEDSTKVETTTKNLIDNAALNNNLSHPTVHNSVVSESSKKKDFIQSKNTEIVEGNKPMTSDLLSTNEKVKATAKTFTKVEKQSSKVTNFPFVKNLTLKKKESLTLAKRSIPFKQHTSHGMLIKRNGQNEKLSGSKNLETGSQTFLNSIEKGSKKSVGERIDLTKGKALNPMAKKLDTTNLSNKKPTLKKVASPMENVIRPGHTSEMSTTRRTDAKVAKKPESSFNILPEKSYRNKFLNKLYSQVFVH
jgi:hypothetical protein